MAAIFITLGVAVLGILLILGGVTGNFSSLLTSTAPVLIGVVIVIAATIGIYNTLITLKNQVKNAYSQIKVQLKRRHDLIPNLIEAVKQYMNYEESVLQKVVEARSLASKVSTDAKMQAENENNLSSALKSLFAVCENYPELKANQSFLSLQEELSSTENKISFARQFYNDMVMKYNTKKEIFPYNIISGVFNFDNFELFDLDDKSEGEVVKVDFGR